MNYFAMLSPVEQIERIQKLAASGMRENAIATLSGWRVQDICRVLAPTKTPRLAAVDSAAFFTVQS